MGDNINACSSSSSAHHHDYNPPCSSDEISHFLRQILVRSSSSSSPSPAISRGDPQGQQCLWSPPSLSPSIVANPGISAFDLPDHVRSGTGAGYGTSGACFSENVLGNAALMSSSSVGVNENDTDEYDCESEEGLEALIDDPPAKPAPPRSSSKRSRAAEVHNLSEKRRRSRINEKMKALQNLIPNSNKTDKASMLDEAIEYLKKLQLQVQMLSMRNGLSLHPMCLPGVLQPMQISQTRTSFGEENGSLHMNMTSTLHVNQDSSAQTVFNLPNQCTFSNRVSVPDMPDIINSETSFVMELPIQRQFGLFQLLSSPEEICREDILPHHQLNVGNSKTNPSEFEVGVMAMVSNPFDTASDLKESSPMDACVAGRDQSDSMLLKNKERNLILPPQLTGFFSRIQRGSAPSDDIKLERPDF